MVNALIEHEDTVVDRHDLAWRVMDNCVGLQDITISMYFKMYIDFEQYFSDRGNVIANKVCICSEEVNQDAPSFRHCVVIFPSHEMFLNWVVMSEARLLTWFCCQSSSDEVVRRLYLKLDCNIQFVCIPPAPNTSHFFYEHKKPDEEYSLLYWPAELLTRISVGMPNFNLHMAQGIAEYWSRLNKNPNQDTTRMTLK